jgi:hypothetical protein
MSEETKKVETKVEQAEQEATAELPEQDLDKVAGGVTTRYDLKQQSSA